MMNCQQLTFFNCEEYYIGQISISALINLMVKGTFQVLIEEEEEGVQKMHLNVMKTISFRTKIVQTLLKYLNDDKE